MTRASLGSRILIVVLLVAGASRLAAQEADQPSFTLDQLAFLAGCWEGPFMQDSVEGTMEEHYTTPSENFMLGTTRYMIAGRTVDYELAVIARGEDGRVVLGTYPGGIMGMPFTLVQVVDGTAIFENPDNEFPKRVIYRETSDGGLHARIDGGVGTDGMDWWLSAAECVAGGG
jgi:hypothetical protein